MSSPFESSLSELSHLFSPLKWRILTRITLKPSLKLLRTTVCRNTIFQSPLKPPTKHGGGLALTEESMSPLRIPTPIEHHVETNQSS